MRPRVSGMNALDDAILEFFDEQTDDIVMSPSIVWWNLSKSRKITDKSRETVARRMRKLPEFGLLERVDDDRAYYRITDKGRAYLSGDLEANDLENGEEDSPQ